MFPEPDVFSYQSPTLRAVDSSSERRRLLLTVCTSCCSSAAPTLSSAHRSCPAAPECNTHTHTHTRVQQVCTVLHLPATQQLLMKRVTHAHSHMHTHPALQLVLFNDLRDSLLMTQTSAGRVQTAKLLNKKHTEAHVINRLIDRSAAPGSNEKVPERSRSRENETSHRKQFKSFISSKESPNTTRSVGGCGRSSVRSCDIISLLLIMLTIQFY